MDCSRSKTKNPDDWLAMAPDFSRPLAAEVREWIVRWEPDLTESIKWNCLAFTGRKLVCGLSACQRHLGIVFFRGTELRDLAGLFDPGSEDNTNIRNIRLTSLAGLERGAFRMLLHAAVALDADATIPSAPKIKREPWPGPDFFTKALKRHRAAAAGFAKLSPSCQREYLVWLTTAKRPETRARRLAETLAALSTGRKWAQRRSA
jgi:uncharacterized protein YdeI (YjbR/CyaY-like superfamily)